ncbi:hypothetical protein EIB18_09385 [Caulobacter vibrioides]|uniref:Uncharacterized protein n=2 Tax=Caulobacter vibrioides TaxID=155892 RepID=A0A0H3CAF8_CAUVN|nr:hypothetical protein [Caulobacter vibrioides]YP_002517215.1 hypothetical protein CCNA_01842 [Caulobacter vibrioides NA1000]ACL95307.1 hypothetical protein CCNA_01842 [Caulobacter vibrioides NA1000]ATC24759.1 hypothetical protein CA608_09645 [Caulobacter vibrioides]ATC28643.1 hypothetical protein CA607_09730 [Caulobacter vibrioides]ATC33009.1 hypothetical protein CA606_12105 [Caulobacter vibrioides]AZH12899.1 hypothetical protein EIB18_09385 [Caulobacter vibrioides]
MTAFSPATMPATDDDKRAVERLAEASHRLNDAVRRAIAAGYSVELVRTSRHHDGAGNWGDQIVPTVREKGAEKSA